MTSMHVTSRELIAFATYGIQLRGLAAVGQARCATCFLHKHMLFAGLLHRGQPYVDALQAAIEDATAAIGLDPTSADALLTRAMAHAAVSEFPVRG